jgi:hypothetical protein
MEGEKASISAVDNAQDRKHVEFMMRPQEQIENLRKTGNKVKREPGLADQLTSKR